VESRTRTSRGAWALALLLVAAPLALVAGSWDEINGGDGVEQTASAASSQQDPSAIDSEAEASGEDVASEVPTGPGARPLRNPRGYVALTYDDGPHEELTPQLLDTLAAYRAPATFFVQGNHTSEHPEIVQRELDEGHGVGNHTYDHLDLTATDDEQARRQLLGTNEVLDEEVGFQPELYRPPYDRHDPGVDAIAAELGLTRASWTYRHDPHDWDDPSGEGKPAQEVCDQVVTEAAAGDVILMHDRFAGTVEAAPCVISGLRERGLEPGRLEIADKASPKNGDSFIAVVP
jgi:peptidoglycan-N-acetylglucosamine deacetylase